MVKGCGGVRDLYWLLLLWRYCEGHSCVSGDSMGVVVDVCVEY